MLMVVAVESTTNQVVCVRRLLLSLHDSLTCCEATDGCDKQLRLTSTLL